jgi:hypothetical protein
MTHIKNIISLFAFTLLLVGLPTIASAQWNGGYGGYGNGRYNRDIRGTVENLKRGARDFERVVDRGNSRYNDRYGNDRNLRNLADRFTDATKDLASSYGRGRNLGNSQDEARRVLEIASQIDRELSYSRGGYGGYGGYNGGLSGEWSRMRYDLQILADTYGYGGYNGRGGRNNNGNWRNRVPFPLPF